MKAARWLRFLGAMGVVSIVVSCFVERWSALHFPDPQGRDHRVLVNQEIRLTDTARVAPGNDLALSRRFTGFKEGVSYDHRVIDGALAARFTRRLASILEDVRQLVL